MCDFESRLIAWMDCELEADDALQVERHLRICTACAARVGQYRAVSSAFADYCRAVATTKHRSRWAILSAAAAATIAVVLLLARPQVKPPPFEPPPANKPVTVLPTEPLQRAALVKRTRPRQAAKRVQIQEPELSMNPSIEIAIPVEDVFAPGAVPRGFSFAAKLTIANDGSPKALWFRP